MNDINKNINIKNSFNNKKKENIEEHINEIFDITTNPEHISSRIKEALELLEPEQNAIIKRKLREKK